jgi:ABC-2 type transport system ATP-binding protein
LYRAGRAPDALDAYKLVRARLADELALDPEPQLRQLQNAILCADPALDVPCQQIIGTPRRNALAPHPAPASPVKELVARPAEPAVPPTMTGVALEARGLSKWFGSRAAVDGLSFTARQGEVVGLLGPNGAGKTTTIRLLSTVLTPTSGEFSVAGVPFTRPAEIRRRIGVLPESAGYPEHQTGREYLRYHARLFGSTRSDADALAERLLAEVGLAERASSRISAYSRGMRQRLGIARALVNDPAVVLLDEPTLGLDPAGQRQVLAIVREIAARRQATVLLSTHTLPEVEEVCTAVLILDNGKVLTSGTVGEVTRAAVVRRSGRLRVPVELVDRARHALAGVAGISLRANERPDVILISLTADPDERPGHAGSGMNAALDAVLTAGVPILSYDVDGTRVGDDLFTTSQATS